MEILSGLEKITVYTTEKQAQFMRAEILRCKIKVLDLKLDFILFENNGTVKLIVTFSNQDELNVFIDNHLNQLLNKTLMHSDTDFQIVKFLDSHIYVFSKSLKWGKKYSNREANITFRILQKEKIEADKRKKYINKLKGI